MRFPDTQKKKCSTSEVNRVSAWQYVYILNLSEVVRLTFYTWTNARRCDIFDATWSSGDMRSVSDIKLMFVTQPSPSADNRRRRRSTADVQDPCGAALLHGSWEVTTVEVFRENHFPFHHLDLDFTLFLNILSKSKTDLITYLRMHLLFFLVYIIMQ